jgi:hypothetical protein
VKKWSCGKVLRNQDNVFAKLRSVKLQLACCARLRITMHRGVSIAVLTILLAGMLSPLAQDGPLSAPVCCRVGGQHHCMGKAGLDGFRSLASQCPYRAYPAVTSARAAAIARASSVPQRQVVAVVSVQSAGVQKIVTASDIRKRGPPSA